MFLLEFYYYSNQFDKAAQITRRLAESENLTDCVLCVNSHVQIEWIQNQGNLPWIVDFEDAPMNALESVRVPL